MSGSIAEVASALIAHNSEQGVLAGNQPCEPHAFAAASG